ncbi:hypothetical protein ZTR_00271 [Talaromyces verruculosus]|nr:hypothetical protein ZTR_00271 [Talaromyces verruculosus]
MTKICVKYLLMDDLVSNTTESVQSLLDYSAENWANHFRDVASPDVEVVDRVWKLYDVSTERFCLWFPKFWAAAMPTYEDPKMDTVHLAAFNGHSDIICRMDFETTDTVDRMDRSGRTALQWASERGNLEIIQLLLERGADVNSQGGEYGNALQGAAREGHFGVVQLLIEKGAKVNAQGGEYGNALLGAVRKGHFEVVQLLIEKGANVNTKAATPVMTALHFSALKGDVGMTKFMCSYHANPNAQSETGDTPLHLAIRRRVLGRGYNDYWIAGEYAVEDLGDLITD